jgi:hypothetical protein
MTSRAILLGWPLAAGRPLPVGGAPAIPSNVVTFNGVPVTFNGQFVTYGAAA